MKNFPAFFSSMLLACLLFSTTHCLAQKRQPDKPVDSVEYYSKKLSKLWKSTFDSLRKTDEYKSLNERIRFLRSKRNGYGAFFISTEYVRHDFTSLNKAIALNGFPALKPSSLRFGLGMSIKEKRLVADIYFFILSLNSVSSNDSAKIRTAVSNFLQFDIGYDLLNTRSFSIYPFAGLSLRSSELQYTRGVQINPNYTSVADIIVNNRNAYAFSRNLLGYQAGLGMDVLLSKKDESGGVYLNLKGGTSGFFSAASYDVEGVTYKPGIQQNKWIVSIGFKFFGR